MGNNSGNFEIENSNFCRERPCVSLHVLCCRVEIKSATTKSKIGNFEIENFDFKWRGHLFHCMCSATAWEQSATLKSKIERYFTFRIPLHVLCCCMGSNNATLKLEIERYSTFYIRLHVLYCWGSKVQH